MIPQISLIFLIIIILTANFSQSFFLILNDIDHLKPCCSFWKQILQKLLACFLLCNLFGIFFSKAPHVSGLHLHNVTKKHRSLILWIFPLGVIVLDAQLRLFALDCMDNTKWSEFTQKLFLLEEKIRVIDVCISSILNVLKCFRWKVLFLTGQGFFLKNLFFLDLMGILLIEKLLYQWLLKVCNH